MCVLDDVRHSTEASFASVQCYLPCISISFWEERYLRILHDLKRYDHGGDQEVKGKTCVQAAY